MKRISFCEKHARLTEAVIDPRNCAFCLQNVDKPIKDQPHPTPRETRPIWEIVIEDMKERDWIGRQRYGTPLQAHNGRDALVDAYQEALDLAVYLRQTIVERDGPKPKCIGLEKAHADGNCPAHPRDFR